MHTHAGEDEDFAEHFCWDNIGDDKSRADVTPQNKWVSHAVSSHEGAPFAIVERAIRETYTQYKVE